MFVNSALLCLALNVYMEARGEIIPGQYAVALVTMKRAKHDEDRVCREVFRSKQFSWANKGVTKVKGGWEINQRLVPKEDHAWWVANRVASMTLNNRMPDFVGADHYHTRAVNPKWNKGQRVVKKIGTHVFYRIA